MCELAVHQNEHEAGVDGDERGLMEKTRVGATLLVWMGWGGLVGALRLGFLVALSIVCLT